MSDTECPPETVERDAEVPELDENTVAYYKRVLDSLEEEIQNDEEEKELFFNNVFQQLETEAAIVSKHKVTSHIVEKLINHASDENLLSFMKNLVQDDESWKNLLCEKFASHVVESVLNAAFTKIYCSSDSNFDEGIKVIAKLCKVVLENLDELIVHVYASHTVRTLLEVVAGVKVSELVLRSRASRDTRYASSNQDSKKIDIKNVRPEKFTKLLVKFTNALLSSKKLEEYARCQLANPVLQTLFLCLKTADSESCQRQCKVLVGNVGIFNTCSDVSVAPEMTVSLPDVVVDVTASHLVDQLLRLVSPDLVADLFDNWKDKLIGFALHPCANYVLQRFLGRLTFEQYNVAYDELKDLIEDLLALNHLGVVVEMAEAASRLGTKQKSLIKHLMKAFHCYSPAERQVRFVPLIVSLTTYDVLYPSSDEKKNEDDSDESDEVKPSRPFEYNLHGSLLLQKMFKFGDPSLLVTSLLAMTSQHVTHMACNPIGSHVLEAFVSSNSVGEKTRDQLYAKLKDHYVELACDKTGSRTFDAMWRHSSVIAKSLIAAALSTKEAKLKGNRFGQFIHKKCAVEHYVHRRADWESIITGQVKRRRMFESIIDGGEPIMTKSKRAKPDSKEVAKNDSDKNFPEKTKKVPHEHSTENKNLTKPKGDEIPLKRPCAKKRRRMKKMGLWGK